MIDYKNYEDYVKNFNPAEMYDLLSWIKRDIKIKLYDVFSDDLILKNYKTEDSFDSLDVFFYFEDKPSLKNISDEIKLEFLNNLGFSDVNFVQSDYSETYFKMYTSSFNSKPTGWYKYGGMITLEDGSKTGNPIWFGKIENG